MLARKRHFAALKESKENFVKKNRRFVVTEFVKTCDELVIGLGCWKNSRI